MFTNELSFRELVEVLWAMPATLRMTLAETLGAVTFRGPSEYPNVVLTINGHSAIIG